MATNNLIETYEANERREVFILFLLQMPTINASPKHWYVANRLFEVRSRKVEFYVVTTVIKEDPAYIFFLLVVH
jgi:hypothetical protein